MLRKLQISFLYLLLVLVWFCGERTFAQTPFATTNALTFSGTVGNYTLSSTVSGTIPPSGTISFYDTNHSNALVGTAALGPATSQQSFLQMASLAPSVAPLNLISGDFNGDGKQDLISEAWDRSKLSLFLGNGDGTFQGERVLNIPALSINTMVGDFNGDGKLDLAITSNDFSSGAMGWIEVWFGNGDGTFSQGPTTSLPLQGNQYDGATAADVNGDGRLDIVIETLINNSSGGVSVLLGNGNGTFQSPMVSTIGVPNPGNNLKVGDIDGDGKQDLVLYNGTIMVSLGNGNGSFQGAIAVPGADAGVQYVGDINGDGRADIVALNSGTENAFQVLLSTGGGAFTPSYTATMTGNIIYSAVVGDFNLDGSPDIEILGVNSSTLQGNSYIFYGNGQGSFQQQGPFAVQGGIAGFVGLVSVSADFNGDGLPDVACACSASVSPGGVLVQLDQLASSATATLGGVNVRGAGTHFVDATYPGGSRDQASTSNTVPLIGSGTPTAISLTNAPNPSIVTNTVNAQIQVTAADGSIPTGSVTVVADGNTLLGTPTLNGGGAAALSFNSLPVGAHSITASYPQNVTYESSSVTVTQTVNAIPTNTVVSANPASSTYLQCVSFSATVSATEGTPSGTVSFTAVASQTSVNLGTATLNGSGVASVSTCSLNPMTYTITAHYNGATNFAPSAGTTTEAVTTLRVSIPVPISPAQPPFHPGSPISITIPGFPTPSGGAPPAQSITVYGGSSSSGGGSTVWNPIGTVPPTGGGITWTPPGPGIYPIATCYPGDSHYANNCTPVTVLSPISITVTAPTTLSVLATPNPSTFGQSASVVATVSSAYGVPTGSVSCSADSSSLGSGSVVGGGTVTLSSGVMSVGSHPIACNFVPTGTFDPSSGGTTEVVTKATPKVQVAFSPEPSYPGDVVTITAAVSGVSAAVPTGSVAFAVDGTNVGTAQLSGGVATLAYEFTTVANHNVVATYNGDGNYFTANGTGIHSVVKLPTTTTVSATPKPGIGGLQTVTIQSVSIFPDVALGSANKRLPMTGTVQFFDGGVSLGSVPINGTTELATLSLPSMTVGDHSLTATYSGDPNYLPSSAAAGAFIETLVPPISGVSVTGNANVATGSSVTFAAMVVNPLKQPQPTGTVTWSSNGVALGTSQVASDGTSSYTAAFPAPGIYTLVASYQGESEPGATTFTQNVLSSTAAGSAPFVMTAPATVSMGTDGSANVALNISSGGVSTPIALACSGAPAGYTCNLSPASLSLAPGAAASSVAVSITPNATTQAQERTSSNESLAGLGLGVLLLCGCRTRRRSLSLLVFFLCLMGAVVGVSGCGTAKQYASNVPQSYSVTVTASVETYHEQVVVNITR
jgi:Bacterial Ig-like domain (group 3)/FG-GAP-like repeat